MQSNSVNGQPDIANITVVTDERQVIVPQAITSVVEVNNPGPQGPIGPQGETGPSVPFTNIGNDVYATTSSLQVTGSFLVSGSSTFTNIGPAIFSGSVNATSGVTMSSALVSGNVTVLGTASIGTLVVNQTVLSTGSNQLGDSANDTQTLYGTVVVPTGSLTVTGSARVSGDTQLNRLGVGINISSWMAAGAIVGTDTYFNKVTSGGSNGGLTLVGSPTINSIYTGADQSYDSANNLAISTFNGGRTWMYISSSGNVGIGTTTPAYKLDVVSGSIRSLSTSSFAYNRIETTVSAGSLGVGMEFKNGANTTTIGANTTRTYIYSGQGSTENFTILHTGNVGIGTTTPQQSLEISGSGIRISGAGSKVFEFSDASFAAVRAIFGSMSIRTSTGLYVGNNEQAPLARLHVSGSSSDSAILRVDSPTSSSILYVSGSGNVGIGTNTPAFKLDVVSSTGYSAIGIQTAASTNAEINFKNAAYSLPRWTIRASAAADGVSGNLVFQRFASTFPMTITSGDNVLIGTSVDSARLMVKGSGTTSGTTTLRVENNNTSASLVVLDDGKVTIGRTDGAYVEVGTLSNFYNTSVGYNHVFRVGGTEVVRIDGSGDIGIGTNNPLYKLDVYGTYHQSQSQGEIARYDISNANADQNRGVWNFYTNASATADFFGRFGFKFEGGITDAYKQFQVHIGDSTTPKFIINGSGNVGIGTITPGAKLDVVGTTYLRGVALDSIFGYTGDNITFINLGYTTFQSNLGIGVVTPSARFHISGSTSQALLIASSSAGPALYVSGSGFVGIGTNNPSANIHIANSSSATIRLQNVGGSASDVFISSGNGKLELVGNAAASARITLNQFAKTIGINNQSPNAALDVVGSGATSATNTFLVKNSTPTTLLTIIDNGQVSFTSPTMSLAASQSAFSISPIISASNVIGGQYYGVNITPTFFQTTGSQTETAFRVAATFTSSNATATTGSNIIADFGSTSAGSQLTVTDVTSGSIYMVNDVSGIPIIEATSNWDVNIYDFPNKVFEKTGSQVNIYGTMRVSGSFILPLSQSVAPQTGSAYWSGSLLFIYDGTRYRSSSFA